MSFMFPFLSYKDTIADENFEAFYIYHLATKKMSIFSKPKLTFIGKVYWPLILVPCGQRSLLIDSTGASALRIRRKPQELILFGGLPPRLLNRISRHLNLIFENNRENGVTLPRNLSIDEAVDTLRWLSETLESSQLRIGYLRERARQMQFDMQRELQPYYEALRDIENRAYNEYWRLYPVVQENVKRIRMLYETAIQLTSDASEMERLKKEMEYGIRNQWSSLERIKQEAEQARNQISVQISAIISRYNSEMREAKRQINEEENVVNVISDEFIQFKARKPMEILVPFWVLQYKKRKSHAYRCYGPRLMKKFPLVNHIRFVKIFKEFERMLPKKLCNLSFPENVDSFTEYVKKRIENEPECRQALLQKYLEKVILGKHFGKSFSKVAV